MWKGGERNGPDYTKPAEHTASAVQRTLELTFSVKVEEEVASFRVFYGGLACRD